MSELEETKSWLEAHVHRTYNKNTEEFYVMLEMLKKHPNYPNWKKKDIEYFQITRAPKKKFLQVYIKVEGNKNSRLVSWKSCVTGKINKTDNLALAMRNSIKDQINEYVFRHPVKKCVLCETYNNIEVDHYPVKFRELKKDFIDENEIPKTRFYRNKHILCDDIFETEWKEYHKNNASYRYLCATCNQKSH